MSVRLRWGVVSITGNFRQNNEDRVHIDPEGRYFLVCDGMGGQLAGEKASELATELVPQKLDQLLTFKSEPPERVASAINDAICHANGEILALGQLDPQYHSMGTTLAMLVRVGRTLYIASVGDSRVYCLRNGTFEQLTRDDSLSQALLEAKTITKEEAAVHRYKHVLIKYLGSKEAGVGTTPVQVELAPGERFLICSDGVTDGTDDAVLQQTLQSYANPQEAAEKVVAAAQAGGSKDNISCIVVHVEPA